ncbi:pilus assembly protein [Vibrio navarrensis]|uniref:Pilus assembly protein n=1 Tax=Vibrio navarrensis TaxID=29495 RepID=A0AAI9G8T1_9VIBR|nr:pilus assembly protein [Vibrio navarrensis]EJL6395232.1 pilus assembly protein [Vibrio navarrensis]EKA5636621.1 pilus assembly protein [Vibrio navarrensis]ELN6932677.1 pilus assembly protein [Vibrio navarrensis]
MKQYCRLHRQSGHAAILFALFIPFLFGVFTLGTDGARAVQDKARLLEAVEVASLAVAGQGSDNAALAKNYLEYYFPSATINNNDIQIKKINCEDNANCKNSNRRFFEYQVSAKISQPTWFPGNDAIIGFGENYAVAGHSSARKFHAETVDVVLVADFSGSMAWRWDRYGPESASNPVRYIMMKEIISEIADELEKFNKTMVKKNKLSVVGFDFFTVEKQPNGSFKHYDHIICSNKRCNSYYQPGKNSDVSKNTVVDNIFNLSHVSHSVERLTTYGSASGYSTFFNIPLTDNFKSLKDDVDTFSVRGSSISGTSSYAGIIRGAQLAMTGVNPRRLIIILSDGEDSFITNTNNLISAGMCTKILETLNAQIIGGENVKARMVAVGFAYDITTYPQMKNCVGQENVFSAKNRDDIKNKILELITEEIGHLAL